MQTRKSISPRVRNLGAVLFACVLSASLAHAQDGGQRTLSGVVRDSSGAAITFAVVQSRSGQKAATDDTGGFVLRLPAHNPITVEFRRIGFRPVDLRLSPGPDTVVSITMIQVAQMLPETRVQAIAAASRSLELRGFYRRLADRNRGILNGEFITPEDIEQRKPPRISFMADGLQGVRVLKRSSNALAWEIRGPGGCLMTVFLDGIRLNSLSSAGNRMRDYLDQLVTPTSVAGMEIYGRGNRAPTEYQSLAGSCGVILIWTR